MATDLDVMPVAAYSRLLESASSTIAHGQQTAAEVSFMTEPAQSSLGRVNSGFFLVRNVSAAVLSFFTTWRDHLTLLCSQPHWDGFQPPTLKCHDQLVLNSMLHQPTRTKVCISHVVAM